MQCEYNIAMNADRLGLSQLLLEPRQQLVQKRPNPLAEKRSAAGYRSVIFPRAAGSRCLRGI